MHELSFAADIVDKVLDYAAAQKLARVVEVRVEIGEWTQVEADQLQFCYASITKDTVLDGSQLLLESVQAKVECPACGYQGRPKYWTEALTYAIPTLQCPNCEEAATATEGHDCAIKSIKFVR